MDNNLNKNQTLLLAYSVHAYYRECTDITCYAQWRVQDLRKGVSKFVEKAHVAAV